jgi:hypothetical protein
VLKTLQVRVAANALDLARQGVPKNPFYLTGQIGEKPFSLHAEGERVIFTRDGQRQEVDLAAPGAPVEVPAAPPPVALPTPLCPAGLVTAAEGVAEADGDDSPPAPPPGTSPLDAGLTALRDAFGSEGGGA